MATALHSGSSTRAYFRAGERDWLLTLSADLTGPITSGGQTQVALLAGAGLSRRLGAWTGHALALAGPRWLDTARPEDPEWRLRAVPSIGVRLAAHRVIARLGRGLHVMLAPSVTLLADLGRVRTVANGRAGGAFVYASLGIALGG
ncbi:MAG TPA: hypothetical protein VFK85_09115 [Anaeromyxobacteraceae bacterium]|nr:hypothetical protein [Anaeromyxobacteraceae bacterium]